MNLKKLLAVCVYGACFLAGLFVLIANTSLFQAFSLFGAGPQGIVVGVIYIVALVLIFAAMLVPAIGCIMMFANKTDPAKVGGATTELSKGLFFCLWLLLGIVAPILATLLTNPEAALSLLQGLVKEPLFWVTLIMVIAGSTLTLVGKNKSGEYNVVKAVLYMVGAALLLVAFFVAPFSNNGLIIVAQILVAGALVAHAVKTSLLK